MTLARGLRAGRRWLAPALLVLAAAGCALPELAWQRLDEIVVGRADHWLDLAPRQEQALHERLVPWLRTVRRERLPAIAAFLDALAARVEPDIDLADMRWAGRRFDRLYAETVRSFLPAIAPTLADLSPQQRAHLERRMHEANEDYRADFIDGRDQGMYALAERVIAAVEPWTGPLDTDQRSLVHQRVRALPRTQPQWLRFRERMQQQLLARIEDGAAPTQIERTLRQWWIEPLVGGIGELEDTRALRDGILRTLVALGRSLSAEQRAEARRRLHARAADLQTLAASAD